MSSSEWDTSFWMSGPLAGDPWQVFPTNASFGHDDLMVGTGSFTFPYNSDAVTLYHQYTAGGIGFEFPQVCIRVRCRGATTWVGVALSASMSSTKRGYVDINFEHLFGAFHRWRQVYGASNLAAVDYNLPADNTALQLQRFQLDGTLVPTGYPTFRTAYGSFTPTVVANHSTPLAPTRRLIAQSGKNLLETMRPYYETQDLAPVFSDNEDGTFTIDNDYPFANNDKSGIVNFGQYHGNLASFRLLADRGPLSNVWAIEGKTPRAALFAKGSNASIAAWGEIEGFKQMPEDTHVSSVIAVEATEHAARYDVARTTYECGIIEIPGQEWITDFNWRDTIRIDEGIWGIQVDQVIRAWNMNVTDGKHHELSLLLSHPRMPDGMREAIGYTGLDGPTRMGSLMRNARQH